MRIRKIPIAIALLASLVALACGPQFEQLLPARKETLAAPVGFDFSHAARHMAAPLAPAARPPARGASTALAGARTPADLDRAMAQVDGLTPAQAARIAQMRDQDTGDAAYALGADLPPAYRLYAAAAVDFQAGMPANCSDGDPADSAPAPASAASAADERARCGELSDAATTRLRHAAARFEALLKLDPQAGRPRAAWAAFSLGRVRRALDEPDAAIAAFRLACARVAQGAGDPLQLATASLGEEARVELEREHVAQAVALYQQQAASGGDDADMAVWSLRQVASTLYGDRAHLKDTVADPVSRRLVVTYLLALGETYDEPMAAADGASTAASAPGPDTPRGRMNALLDAIAAVGARHGPLQDADRVAALAYQDGRYPLAARFAAQSTSPLALWIQAKLALRAGHRDEAAALFAQAVEAMAAAHDAEAAQLDDARLQAEAGTLRLSRGEFVQSLELWWQCGDRYWLDLAYVADRAVTTDELKAFVDAHVPATQPASADPERHEQGDELMNHIDSAREPLRDLLARRLMRDGRVDEAIAYFHAPDKRPEFADVRTQAVAYRKLLADTQKARTPLQRATLRFASAQLVREHGLELFGYELGPDDVAAEGEYQFGEAPPVAGPYTTAAEVARFRQTVVQPDGRFHYRGQAALIAAKAADDLPPKSQAYAAVLCRAASWTTERQPEVARALYKRYVKTGAAFPWASHFGSDCPAPDFKRLR